MKHIVIIGAGGHALSVANVALSAGFTIDAFVDNKKNITELFSIPVIDEANDLSKMKPKNIAIALGDNALREKIYQKIIKNYPNASFPSLVHKSAIISSFSELGQGTVIMPQAVVGPGTKIGDFCIVNTSSSIDHDGQMHNFSSLAPGVVTGGEVKIGIRTAVSIGSSIKHGITIGDDSVIGANSYVHSNIESLVVAFGSPAVVKKKREVGDSYLH